MGNPTYSAVTLIRDGERLSGELDGDPVTGSATGKAIRFSAQSAKGVVYVFAGM